MVHQRHATRLICSLTAQNIDGMRAQLTTAVDAGADVVEVRVDFLSDEPADERLAGLIAESPVDVLVTYRPMRQGGRYDGNESQRVALLTRALAMGARWIDVELDTPAELQPGGETILSHHDFDGCPDDLDAIAATLDASPAEINKVAFAAAGPEDGLRALDLVRSCHKPTIALAMNEAGLLSRILGRKFGAFGTFAALSAETVATPGQPTIDQLKNLYRWDSLTEATTCYGVIGCPVGHSMSPAIHNAAFAAADLDAVYVPLLIQPGRENFNRFMDAVLARPWLDWRGLSVTIPHKENALAYVGADHCDELAVQIGAINTITIEADGTLRGDNTDYAAAMKALRGAMSIGRTELAGRSVAVLGAGGAARAIVAALAHDGADLTIYNRTLSRAEVIAADFGGVARPLEAAASLDAEIVINCTPIGMHPNCDATPLSTIPTSATVVFDTIYNPIETTLLAAAKRAGCHLVSGLEMFVNQAVAQFERWTGRAAPQNVMRRTVLSQLGVGPMPGEA